MVKKIQSQRIPGVRKKKRTESNPKFSDPFASVLPPPATSSILLTDAQKKALSLLGSKATHTMLYGGSRSGKTWLLVRAIIFRAAAASKSRHAILRYRFSHCRTSIMMDTFPSVISKCFPALRHKINQTDSYAELSNGSQIWFGGLDDKDRVEKILGNEYATIFLNECSQIPYQSRIIALTRLAQVCKIDGIPAKKSYTLTPRIYYDCNPPTRKHWTYKLFIEGVDPVDHKKIDNPSDYQSMLINPVDNINNLPVGYLDILKNLPARQRLRFLEGKFQDDSAGMLWSSELILQNKVLGSELPDMQRVVVGVDPSGSRDINNIGNDEIGIVVCGLGTDGKGYILEDLSLKAGPSTWGRVAGMAYERHMADAVVGEENYGGAMVEHTIRTYSPNISYRKVTATRNKIVRAEPISALSELNRIKFAGNFPLLEDELCGMTTAGYINEGSPNRADAMIWSFTELFGDIVTGSTKHKYIRRPARDWRVA